VPFGSSPRFQVIGDSKLLKTPDKTAVEVKVGLGVSAKLGVKVGDEVGVRSEVGVEV
jgi:hypothetical protein